MGNSEKPHTAGGKRKRPSKHDVKVDAKKKILGKAPKPVISKPQTAKDCDANWKILKAQLSKKKEEKTSANVSKFSTTKMRAKSSQTITKPSTKKKPDIWFDDVPEEEILLAEGIPMHNGEESSTASTEKQLVKPNAYGGLTKAVGMDCEMVGTGYKGSQSVLARVSLVNQYGKCIYDKHVKAQEEVTDYRTWVSGIRPSDLKGAEEFGMVQREVAEILKGRVLVGHALHNDLRVLYLTHPKKLIRDTADYKPFRALNNGKTPSLRVLSNKVLGVQVQKGEHSSVQDAQAAMKLYMMHKKQWEKELKLLKAGNK